LVQCELCFQDQSKAFHLDRAKVTFAQSYLKGMTLEWFEPDLLNSSDLADRPCWMDSWVHFVAELQSTFGPHDPIADAEHQLEHLRMKDAHRVTRYIVDFNQLASQVQATETAHSTACSTPVSRTALKTRLLELGNP